VSTAQWWSATAFTILGWCRRETRFVVTLAGDLDLTTASQFHDALVAADGHDVDVDLHALEFIDAGGIGVLASAATRCQHAGARLRVHRTTPFVRQILAVCDLEDLIDSSDGSRSRPYDVPWAAQVAKCRRRLPW
jgi:anti-anti-sigma factor